jgi:hypothetical protein
MASYLLDVICAKNVLTGMNLRWHSFELPVHVYFSILWENTYKKYCSLICDQFIAHIYSLLFKKEYPRLSDASKRVVLKVGHWYLVLVVEPDYLPDSEVLSFSRVYTPWSIYTPEVCTLFHAGECRGGVPPLRGPGGPSPRLGGLGASGPPAGVWGRSPRSKNCLIKVYCNFIVNLDRSL